MKSFAFILLLASGAAFAQNEESSYRREYDDYQVEYLAWCDQNNVVTQDQKGQTKILTNCTEANLVCKTYQIYRRVGSGHLVTAACEKR